MMIPLRARIQESMTRRGRNQNEGSSATIAEGSFAQSIANTTVKNKLCEDENDSNPPSIVVDECDASSCSSSSFSEGEGDDEEDHYIIHNKRAEEGSFPTSPSSLVASSIDHMPLPVVFDEDDFLPKALSVVIEEAEDEEESDGIQEDTTDVDNAKNQIVKSSSIVNEEEAKRISSNPLVQESRDQECTTRNTCTMEVEEINEDAIIHALKIVPSDSSDLTTSDTSTTNVQHNSSKTVCSNTDATCQTVPISITQDSSTICDLSIDLSSSKLEDELDSRLNAILALKEVVFAQRMSIKSSNKERQRLLSRLNNRNKMNKKLNERNRKLEIELALVQEQLRVANSALLKHELKQEVSNDYSPQEQESIFELLHKINEVRKNKKQKEKQKLESDKGNVCASN